MTINCFFSLKPASTVFPPNCGSNSRYGVTKSLWESRNTSTLGKVSPLHASCKWVICYIPSGGGGACLIGPALTMHVMSAIIGELHHLKSFCRGWQYQFFFLLYHIFVMAQKVIYYHVNIISKK
jgi:hypothetical protein